MTDQRVGPVFPYIVPKRPRKAVDPNRPAHFRLKTETWEMLLKEYREGATARFLSKKWRVSMHAIRKRITEHKSTKRDWGDEQAIKQAKEREAEMEEAWRNSPEAISERLFVDRDEEGEGADDPAELARIAMLASGRAMKGRLWGEARALAALAESYSRHAERGGGRKGGDTIETMDLELLFEIVTDETHRVTGRFRLSPEADDTPENELRRAFWKRRADAWAVARASDDALMRRLFAAERRLKELGEEPPVLADSEQAKRGAERALAIATMPDEWIERERRGLEWEDDRQDDDSRAWDADY